MPPAYPFVKSYVDLGPARGPRLALVAHVAEGGGTVGYLSRKNPNGVSVHFVIERSGRVVRMLPLDHMHSSIRPSAIRTSDDADGFYGASAARTVMGEWADTRRSLGPNHASIAVEVEGFAKDGPSATQSFALARLFGGLRDRWPAIRALGHRDFASYKGCPGKLIRWADLDGHGASVPFPDTSTVSRVEFGTGAFYSYVLRDGGIVDRIQEAPFSAPTSAPCTPPRRYPWAGHIAKDLVRVLAGRLEGRHIGVPQGSVKVVE